MRRSVIVMAFAGAATFVLPVTEAAAGNLVGQTFGGTTNVEISNQPDEAGEVCVRFEDGVLDEFGHSDTTSFQSVDISYRQFDLGFATIWWRPGFDGYGFAIPGWFTTYYRDLQGITVRGILFPSTCEPSPG